MFLMIISVFSSQPQVVINAEMRELIGHVRFHGSENGPSKK